VLEDFYGRCEKEGFDKVKLIYDYEYIHPQTGELVEMNHNEPPADLEHEYAFDGLVICTGTNTWSALPCFPGQDNYKGKVSFFFSFLNHTSLMLALSLFAFVI
jgi:hypothetical protein